ncbi:hypothetical protein BDR05DRAFT_1005570 [Suillus weaverae]|nr:hypothetical protein BDR05DRAFT_1005570 [Suillus weaverae]
MAPPLSPCHTHVKNATQHPGLVLLEGKQKWHIKAQIEEDKQHAKDVHIAQEANLQHGIDCITSIEAAMEVEQGIQVTAKAKPVKPCARLVKKKTDRVGAASELTSRSPPVPPAPAQSQGGIKGQDTGDLCEGDVEAVRNEAQ